MNGFADGGNGFFDTDDQLSRYLLSQAANYFSNEQEEKRSMNSQAAAEAHHERVREHLLRNIGGLPKHNPNPAIATIDHVKRDGYSIELVTIESYPDFHVTANCYVPDSEGPHPGILFLCGHVDAPKADWYNQQACIELALNGFVVLIIDPLGQGERNQYHDLAVSGTMVSGGGGTFPHCYAGQKCFYAGANLARYMINDARSGLDYIYQRANVDESRIGVTGSSGGGIQAIYLSFLDDRVDAVAPCCAVSDNRDWIQTGKRTHAEQAITGSIAHGIQRADLIGGMAPRPVCIGAATSDEYFPIEGLYEAVEHVEDVYGLYGAREQVTLVVRDTAHCSVYEFRDGVFEWLCQQLGDAPYESHDTRPTLDASELHCTPSGNVLDSFAAERTIEDLIGEYIEKNYPHAGTSPAVDEGYPEQLREVVIEKFGLDRDDWDLHPRTVDERTEDGLDIEYVCFKTERRPDIVVTGVLVTDPEMTFNSPAIVLYEQGTTALSGRRDEIATLANEHGSVFIFDPRGVGAVRNRAITVPTWWDDYYGIYGTEFKLATDALLLDSSLLGMRVYDVIRAVEFLRSETGSKRVSIIGDGIGAYHGLYTAIVVECVDRLTLRNLGPSFYEMATVRDAPFFPQLTAFDVIGECDVQHLFAALEQRGVQLDGESSAVK